jgi:crotonobetainyl-CoA:carnitine CoA-transferase CaiB-like acyl-CoA transferase
MAARPRRMPELEAMFGRLSRAELLANCEAASLAFAPVNRPEDLFDDPHLAAGGLWDAVLPGDRHARLPGLPFSIGGRRFGTAGAPPAIGQHSRAILAELGFAEADIDALEERGIIRQETP